tara:strand:- start:273 stop:1937 length:1665 start_codon:yes stop_codon:yes gene_type:complete
MTKKLKIGLLINSTDLPLWEFQLIERLKKSNYAKIDLVILNDTPKEALSLYQKIKNNWSSLILILFIKVDEKLFNVEPNAFKIKNTIKLLEEIPLIKTKPVSTKFSDRFVKNDLQKIKDFNLDVLIRFGFKILRGDILNCAKYGVWSYHHGDNDINRGGPAGYWEVIEKNNVTGSILQILNEDLDNGQILFKSFSATNKNSINRNRNNFYWKSLSFLPRKLEELHRLGNEKFFNIINKENQNLKIYSNKLYTKKSLNNWFMIKYILAYLFRGIKTKILNQIYFNQWFILFSIGKGMSTSIWRFKKIIPPKDRFYADPFVIRENEINYVFIEELIYKTNKGHISVVEVDDYGNFNKPIKIIDKKYHLSYPHVFKNEKDYFLIPDSSSNKTIELYKCVEFPYKWEFHMTLMENIRAVDSTIFHYKNKYWLFTNIVENEGASSWDELFLFYADRLETKTWNPHPMNPIISDVRKSRPAGNIFIRDGKIIRPSQDCSVRYGYGVKLNEIITINENEYKEIEIDSIEPNWEEKVKGVHTFNCNENFTIIDGINRRRRLF